MEWTESQEEHRRHRYTESKQASDGGGMWDDQHSSRRWHSQAISKMKNRSLPGDRQGIDLVPVCPLADAAQHCSVHSVVGPGTAQVRNKNKIDARIGDGGEVEQVQCSCAWVVRPGSTLTRLANGQRLSCCGLANGQQRLSCALCSGCVRTKEATTKERDAMRAGMNAGLNGAGQRSTARLRMGRFVRNLHVVLHITSSTRPCKCS
jgi:hypothetical protein